MIPSLPFTIDNGHGESIIFKELIREPDGDKLLLEGRVEPNCGLAMHIHYLQDEHFQVVKGTMSFVTPGTQSANLTKGMSITFLRNQPHKFWNGGEDVLVLDCWIKPANNAVFYLCTLYAATKNQIKPEPNPFDGAFLGTKYQTEYAFPDLPESVKNIIIPITYFVGRLLGKYKKFKNAPKPVK